MAFIASFPTTAPHDADIKIQIFREGANCCPGAFHKIMQYNRKTGSISVRAEDWTPNTRYPIGKQGAIFQLQVFNMDRGVAPTVFWDDPEFWKESTLDFAVPMEYPPDDRIRLLRAIPEQLRQANVLTDEEFEEFDAMVKKRFRA